MTTDRLRGATPLWSPEARAVLALRSCECWRAAGAAVIVNYPRAHGRGERIW